MDVRGAPQRDCDAPRGFQGPDIPPNTVTRVLVTGGAGFIGAHLVERCQREGWSVDVIDDLSTGRRDHVPAGVPILVADVRSDEAARRISSGDYDLVCHLAALMDVRHSVAGPVGYAENNVAGTVAVLESARRARRPPRVLYASTGGAVYGDLHQPPHREDSHPQPDSPYGAAKASSEYFVAYYGRILGLETGSMRIGNVYGPRQNPHGEAGVVAIFLGHLMEGRALTVFGDGRQTRDYIYVGDVCDAFIAAAAADLPPASTVASRTWNVGTGRGTSILELIDALGKAAGHAANIRFAPHRTGEQQHSFLDVRKAERELGWRARTSLEDGLRMTHDWFVAHARPVTT